MVGKCKINGKIKSNKTDCTEIFDMFKEDLSQPLPSNTHVHTQCLHFETRKKAIDWTSLPLKLDLMNDQ